MESFSNRITTSNTLLIVLRTGFPFSHNGIELLDWLAQSPDFNFIEHLWEEVDRRLRKLPVRISGKEDLWDKIQDIWNEIEVDVCMKLIESMPRHINDVIKAKGDYTT